MRKPVSRKVYYLIAALCLFAIGAALPLGTAVKAALSVYGAKPLGTVAQPAKGSSYIDPVFGTKIIRLTDAADGGTSNIAYSYWPAFNSNSTKLIIAHDWNPWLYSFDPNTHAFTKLYSLFDCQCQEMQWQGMSWSATDPNIIYGITGYNSTNRIRAYNVVTKQYVWTKDFTELPGGIPYQMSKARSNDRYFSFHWKPSEGAAIKYAVVYDKELNKTYLFDVTNATYGVPGFDECRLDRDGRYLTMASGREVYVWDFANQQPSQRTVVAYNNVERAGGHTDFGSASMIQADVWGNNGNRIIKRPLTAPATWSQMFDSGVTDWTTDHHISMCGPNDTWALVSTKTIPADYTKPFTNEIFMVKLDGSGQVQRLAHHRASLSEYWTSPRANVSPDGRFFTFNSDWGGGHNDVYVGVLPAGLYGNSTPSTPGTPTATASATPTTGTAPLNVNFTSTASSPNGLITSYSWNFGDGTTGNGPSAAHTYNSVGTYTATLTVKDSANQTVSKSVTITVNAPATIGTPVARITATPASGVAPFATVLDASTSTTPNGTITNYAWNFGDGTTGVGTRLTKTYSAAGNYTATLTVTDSAGKTAQSAIVIAVSAASSGGGTLPGSATTKTFVKNGSTESTTYDVTVIPTLPTYTNDSGLDSRIGGSYNYHTLIALPNIIGSGANQIPAGATITSATLTLTLISGAQATGLKAQRILDPDRIGMWYPGPNVTDTGVGVTYNYRDNRSAAMKRWSNTASNITQVLAAADSTTNLSGGEASGAKINLNVTASVQAWASGQANQGWAISTTAPTANYLVFYDSQYGDGYAPKLVVTYTTGSTGGTGGAGGTGGGSPTTPTQTTLTLRNGDGQAGSTAYDVSFMKAYATYTLSSSAQLKLGSSYGYQSVIAYPSLFGSGTGQIPQGAKIVKATLTFNVSAAANANVMIGLITDPNGKGMWYTGSHGAGYNKGVSYSRRNSITGVKWSDSANNIAQLVPASGSVAITSATKSFSIDVTTSVASWAAGAPNQGWWLSSDTTGTISIYDSTYSNTSLRPVITIVYER